MWEAKFKNTPGSKHSINDKRILVGYKRGEAGGTNQLGLKGKLKKGADAVPSYQC